MKRLALIILMMIPLVGSAQRMVVYTYNSFNYIGLYAYGLPRSVVKTNSEMRATTWNSDGTGVVRRHHTTKGVDERIGDDGYNANDKISFAFMISPYNVDDKGKHTSSTSDTMTWSVASGWDTSIDSAIESYDPVTGVGVGVSTLADTPTGCAAYKGLNDTDKEGDWRLPTQREMQIMFTVIEQTLGYIESENIDAEVLSGIYWTSTEFYASGATGQAWSINNITGQPLDDSKLESRMVRCVKDIYETINE